MRYEAAGAVYHIMARGDGGKNVFDDDKDRYAWTDLMEKAHGRFGWRVHAWVLMGTKVCGAGDGAVSELMRETRFLSGWRPGG